MTTQDRTKLLTKFAIVSIKSSIKAITRIVHLNLEKLVNNVVSDHRIFSHTR